MATLNPQFPTVRFINRPAHVGSSTIQAMMTTLHQQLLLSGWTLAWADATAIGTGTPENPAWSRSVVHNSDSGIVVYRMPTRGHATQWFVRLRMGFGSSASQHATVRGVVIGTHHNDTGGVTGGISETPTTTLGAEANFSFNVVSSEDGFVIASSFGFFLAVERGRRPNGIVEDDISLLYYTIPTGLSSVDNVARLVRSGVGEVHRVSPLVLAHSTQDLEAAGVTASSIVATTPTTSRDGNSLPVIGPYVVGGFPLYGPPRNYFWATLGENPLGSTRSILVDGQMRLYRAVAGRNVARVMLATS